MNYTSIMSYEELFNGPDEDLESYYTRMSRVTKEVLKKHEAEGGWLKKWGGWKSGWLVCKGMKVC